MLEKLIDHLTSSPAAARGLICVPAELAAEFAAELRGVPPIELDCWLELPRDRQAPLAAVALYRCSAGALTVAIVDASARTLHCVLEGPREALGRFAATFTDRSSRVDSTGVLANIKVPTDPPPPPPGAAELDAELADAPAVFVA